MLNPQLNRRPVSLLRRVVLAAALLAIALPIAAASQSTSTPRGTVVDPMDRPLADASVRLTPVANNDQSYETRTNANGAFEFSPVPAGDYMIAVIYPGFSGGRQRVQLRPGEFAFTVKPQVGSLHETISVVGSPGADNPTRDEQSVPPPSTPSCVATGAGRLTPPMKIHDVRPRYKQAWRGSSRPEATLLMQARIGTDGNVRSVDVLTPVNTEMEDEAIAAVSQWRFTPTYLNCEPVEVPMYVTVSFKAGQ